MRALLITSLITEWCFALAQDGPRTFRLVIPGPTAAASNIVTQVQRYPPRLSDLERLEKSDAALLRLAFEQQPLSNKVATAWAVAHLGGRRALETLRKPIEATDPGVVVTFRETGAILSIIRAIGYLAQRDDEAYRFLRSATRYARWSHTAKWKVEEPSTPLQLRFSAAALSALASAGRRGVKQEINAYIRRASPAELSLIAGSVQSAAFYQWYQEKHGQFEFNTQLLRGDDDTLRAFSEFSASKVGQRWSKWVREIVKNASAHQSPSVRTR